MRIAVEGCAHGELEKIYNTIQLLEDQNNVKVDLLICCGDFQATRNQDDLDSMAVPPKFRHMCTFYKYYSGELTAPVLTIVIGGNHEASNHFQELAYGGWLAPNIFYLGYAGVIEIGGIRIAGLSGISKGRDYYKGRYEKVPFDGESIRSCYHIRALDVMRLKQLSKPVDIVLSHDWPSGIHQHGNVQQLLQRKPFFKNDIDSNSLGSKPSAEILDVLQPLYWFSAHLHVKFSALVKHENGSSTKFLALDKCLPRRRFLQLITVPHEGELTLNYDLEWLAILQLTNHLISISKTNSYLPGSGSDGRWKFTPTAEEKETLLKKLKNDLKIPNNFVRTVEPHTPGLMKSSRPSPVAVNPQTSTFCQMLGIDDPLSLLLNQGFSGSDVKSPSVSKLDYSSFQLSPEIEDVSPCRTPMKLPAPSTPLKLPQPIYTSVLPDETKSIVVEPPPACSTPINETIEGTPEKKKFRRRNIAIYSSTE